MKSVMLLLGVTSTNHQHLHPHDPMNLLSWCDTRIELEHTTPQDVTRLFSKVMDSSPVPQQGLKLRVILWEQLFPFSVHTEHLQPCLKKTLNLCNQRKTQYLRWNWVGSENIDIRLYSAFYGKYFANMTRSTYPKNMVSVSSIRQGFLGGRITRAGPCIFSLSL